LGYVEIEQSGIGDRKASNNTTD